jgi:hypothetical protein
MQEARTAAIAADRLRSAGFEVTAGVGGTGVVGLLRNGDGPTVISSRRSRRSCARTCSGRGLGRRIRRRGRRHAPRSLRRLRADGRSAVLRPSLHGDHPRLAAPDRAPVRAGPRENGA